MATSDAASVAAKRAATTTPSPWLGDEPGALNVDTVLQQVSQDDQDEWEYEYSATETEVRFPRCLRLRTVVGESRSGKLTSAPPRLTI